MHVGVCDNNIADMVEQLVQYQEDTVIAEFDTACRELPNSDSLIHACERGEDGEFLEWALELCRVAPETAADNILTGRTLFDNYQEMR